MRPIFKDINRFAARKVMARRHLVFHGIDAVHVKFVWEAFTFKRHSLTTANQ